MLRPHADAENARRNAPQDRKPANSRSSERRLRPLAACRAQAMSIRFCTMTWMRCITRIGKLRRFCTRRGASPLDRSARASGSARMFAAATASCTARLMPTPPTGDIACAASPMQRSPGRCHCAQPIDRHGQQLDVVEALDLARCGRAGTATARARVRGMPTSPSLLDLVDAALRDHVGALPVVAAIEHHHHLAGLDVARWFPRRRRRAARCETRARRSARRCPRPAARRARAPSNGVRRSRPRGRRGSRGRRPASWRARR